MASSYEKSNERLPPQKEENVLLAEGLLAFKEQ